MIDLGVMNDFAHNEQLAIFEHFARGVRQIDGALDAVTEAKLLCQTHGSIANRNDSAGTPDFFNDIAAVMRLDLLLNGRHHTWRAQIHFLPGSCPAGNQVCAHVVLVIPSAAKNLGSSALTGSERIRDISLRST